jgi:hypothetical protein
MSTTRNACTRSSGKELENVSIRIKDAAIRRRKTYTSDD